MRILKYLLATLITFTPQTFASETRWDQVRNSISHQQISISKLWKNFDLLHDRFRASSEPFAKDLYLAELQRLRTMLENRNFEDVDSLQARWLYGNILLELSDYATAHSVYKSMLTEKLPAPFAASVWERLAQCFGRLKDVRQEILSYEHALALTPLSATRSVLLANEAEAWMKQGDLDKAIDKYQLALAPLSQVQMALYGVTTWWGLAVARDRSDDIAGAVAAITIARSYDPTDKRIQDIDWVFEPDYEKYWYWALGEYAYFETSKETEHLKNAITFWEAYLVYAPDQDRWKNMARDRVAFCSRRLHAGGAQ